MPIAAFAVFGFFVFATSVSSVIYTITRPSTATAQAATLNFQARLLNSSGSIVADGNYNVEFKLYDASTGGTLLWTETRDFNGGPDDRVTLKGGYMSVYLGDVNSFPAIDWSQELYLTMNIGGTSTGAPTWDGEMNPRLRLTAVPYAFNTDQLDGLSSEDFVQLGQGSVQADSTTNSSVFINKTGASGNILQLQSGGSDVFVIDNSGDVTVGQTLTVTGSATFNGGLSVASGEQLTNAGSTLLSAIAITDKPAGGNIGTAATTVDVATTFNVNQTTAGQTLTLPNPTSATGGRIAFVNNVGTESFAMYGVTISSARSQAYIWNGSAWTGTNIDGAGSGATAIGTLNGTTKNANGAVIAANTLYLQSADATGCGGGGCAGLVDTAAQSFAGLKTFADGLTVGASSQFTNQGSTLFTATTLSDDADGGPIGTAAATIDVYTTFNINQTTASQTLTLPDPTTTTAGRIAFINNVGSVSFEMYGATIAAGQSNTFIWNGTNWITTVSLSGSYVNSVGTIDSESPKVADGAQISGGALFLQTADASFPGLVSTSSQTFAGQKTFNGGVVLAAQQTLRFVGGTTAQRPAGTIGEVYYDTDTDTLLTYNGTKWVADRGEYIIVASGHGTDPSTQTERDSADYVTDGTADQVQINNALTAASGGKVLLLAGTYVADGTILVSNNTTLTGVGKGTIIELANLDATENLIENSDTTTGTGVTIRDLKLDGRDDLNTAGTQHGIVLADMGDTTTTDRAGATLENITFTRFRDEAIHLTDSENTSITNSTFIDTGKGVELTASSDYNTISSNHFQEVSAQAFDIDGSRNINITNNTLETVGAGSNVYALTTSNNDVLNLVFTGNNIRDSYGGAQILVRTDNSVFSDNIFFNLSASAIRFNSTTYRNVISGNQMDTVGYGIASAPAIEISSGGHNTITGNNIDDAGNTNSVSAISVSNGENNSVTNNHIDSRSNNDHGIDIASSANNTYVSGNTFAGGFANGVIGDDDNSTVYGGQINSTSGNYLIQQAGSITMQSGAANGISLTTGTTGALTLDTGTTGAINIGTNANAKTITVGNVTGATAVNINGGTGGISLQPTGAGAVNISTGTQTGAINVGTGTGIQSLNFGTGGTGAKTVTVGSTAGTSSLTLNSGTGAISIGTTNQARTINIGTAAAAQTVTVGSTNGTSSLTLNSGTGTINLGTGAQARSINLGTGAAAQTVVLGSSNTTSTTTVNAGTGGLSLGSSGVANTIQVGNTTGAVTQTINIGNNATASSTSNVTIGSTVAGNVSLQGPTNVTNRTGGSANTLVVNNSTSTGNILALQDNGGGVFTVADGGNITGTGSYTFSGVTTDITTGTNEDLTVVANGTGVIYLNDTVRLGTLPGDADTDSLLCLNAAGQIDTCQNAALVGDAFVNGGNAFGGTATLGTNEAEDLVFRTDSTTRLTIQADGDIDIGSGSTNLSIISNTTFYGTGIFTNDSASALVAQSTGGTRALTVDTNTRQVGIGLNAVTAATNFNLQVGGDVKVDGTVVEKYLEFTPTATETGWYRIITNNNSYQSGRILVEADYDNKIQSLEFTYSGRRYSGGDEIGTITVLRSLSYNDGPVTQVRVGRNTNADESVLDIYVNSATTPGVIRVYGYGPEVTLDNSATYESDFAAGAETESSTAKVVDALGDNSGLGIATTGNFRGEGLEIGYTGSAAINVGDTSSYLASFQQGTASASLFIGSNASGGVFMQTSSGDNLQINNQGGTVQLNANAGRVSIGDEFTGGAKLRVDTDAGENYIGLIVTQHDTTNNNVALQVENTGSGNSIYVNNAGSGTDFYVTSTGAVGIGAAPNGYQLDINTGGESVVRVKRGVDASNYAGVEFQGNAGLSGTNPLYYAGLIPNSTYFAVASFDGSTETQRIRVNANGDVVLNPNAPSTGTDQFYLDESTGNLGLGAFPNYSLSFNGESSKTIKLEARTSNAIGQSLTIGAGNAGSGATGFAGGALLLQGGAAAGSTGAANGGAVTISGGAAINGGTQGLVNLSTTAFTSASVQTFASSGTFPITAGNVDLYSSLPITASVTGVIATVPDPAQATIGRVLYVAVRSGSQDITLRLNAARTPIDIAIKQNSTATLIWNGTDWTAAGASSSTDLQSAYNNTLTSAGGAEIVLNPVGGNADGFTIRNNATTPIVGGLLEVQSSIGTNLLSVNNYHTERAANGGAEDSSTFGTAWTAVGAATPTRHTTASNVATGLASVQVATTAASNTGVRNNLASNPTTSTEHQVSFTGKLSSGTFTTLQVLYSPNGGTTTVPCTNYSTQTLVTGQWSKVTCTIITGATAVSNPDIIIRQTDSTSRTFWIDNLSFSENTVSSEPSNVQIGGGQLGGAITLLTLDRASAPPVADGNDAYLGSMYYDTTSGRIQCYEADGWGACGSAPNNFVNLTPEYAGAVLNGTGVGTMTADFCADESGVLSVNAAICDGTGSPAVIAGNYYRWTSPQATQQTYSIYVSYQLPAEFGSFADDNTVKLTARTDNVTNGIATYEMFRSEGGTLYACGSETTVTTSANTWQTVSINGNESSGCGFTSASADNTVIFKINVKANSNANVYVGNLSFTTLGQ